MRTLLLSLLIFQLLFQGVAVSHCHSQLAQPNDSSHAGRPHVHLSGHRHHHVDVRASADEAAPSPSQDAPRHDDDAIYVCSEVLTSPLPVPTEIPEPVPTGWLFSTLGSVLKVTLA